MKKKIWLSPPHMGGKELEFVNFAFDTNWIAPSGKNIDYFEKDLTSYLGGNTNICALNSGTAALHLALILLGVQQNDEIICQSMTFSASVNPIIYLGATPVFVDSEKDTWNMCPLLLEETIKDRISKGNKPKAIIAVHLYGMPYKVAEINSVANKYNIPVLEDSAEALGSTYNNEKCGTFGRISILSFNGNKIITTSGGGALVSHSADIIQKATFLATQAKDKASHYQHSEIGYNYRMSNVLAGIGRGQMIALDEHIIARRKNYDSYKKALSNYDEISFLEEPNKMFSNRWLTCVLTSSLKLRERIRLNLEKQNIESRPLWKPMHTQPVFAKYPSYTNGISEDLFERGLCLPSGSNLTNDEINRVIKTIKNTLDA